MYTLIIYQMFLPLVSQTVSCYELYVADILCLVGLLNADKLSLNTMLVFLLFILLILYLFLNARKLRKEKSLRYEAETSLKSCSEKQADMEALLNNRDKMISILSHDLKAPLGHVKTMADMLYASSDLKKEDSEFMISGIRNTLVNSLTLLDNLLLWIQRENGTGVLHTETLDAENVIKENVDLYSGMMSRKRQKAIVVTDAGMVRMDPNVLSLSLRNLLSNAVKFSPETSNIFMWGTNTGTAYQIKICDQGQGMDEDTIARLMKRKDKFTTFGTSGECGHGMGLSLVMDFLEQQGSCLKVETSPGKGCCFSFELPIAQNDRFPET